MKEEYGLRQERAMMYSTQTGVKNYDSGKVVGVSVA